MPQHSNEEVWNQRESLWSNRFTRHPIAWTIGIFIGLWIVLSLLGNALGIANIYWSAERAKITAAPRVTKAIYDPNNIISKVAFFHDKCRAVEKDLLIFQNNQEKYIADFSAAKMQTDPLQKQAALQALGQESSDATAALNIAQQDAADYNSASAQYTQNPFKANNLPYRIDIPAGSNAASTTHINCP